MDVRLEDDYVFNALAIKSLTKEREKIKIRKKTLKKCYTYFLNQLLKIKRSQTSGVFGNCKYKIFLGTLRYIKKKNYQLSKESRELLRESIFLKKNQNFLKEYTDINKKLQK